MTPLEFWRNCQAYERRMKRPAIYFREMYALIVNIHRKENAAPVSGHEVLPLAGDVVKEYKVRAAKKVSKKEYDRLYKLFNS